jgi:hypothetical protein
MLTGYARLRALWRAFRTADAPLPRRAWGLCMAALPLALRARLLRVSTCLSRTPGWLINALVSVGGYLIIATGAVLVLWLWSRIGAAHSTHAETQ